MVLESIPPMKSLVDDMHRIALSIDATGTGPLFWEIACFMRVPNLLQKAIFTSLLNAKNLHFILFKKQFLVLIIIFSSHII